MQVERNLKLGERDVMKPLPEALETLSSALLGSSPPNGASEDGGMAAARAGRSSGGGAAAAAAEGLQQSRSRNSTDGPGAAAQ